MKLCLVVFLGHDLRVWTCSRVGCSRGCSSSAHLGVLGPEAALGASECRASNIAARAEARRSMGPNQQQVEMHSSEIRFAAAKVEFNNVGKINNHHVLLLDEKPGDCIKCGKPCGHAGGFCDFLVVQLDFYGVSSIKN